MNCIYYYYYSFFNILYRNKLLTKYPPQFDINSKIPEHQKLINEFKNRDYSSVDDNELESILIRIRNLSQTISSKINQYNELLNRMYIIL